MNTISILIADDHPLILAGLASLIDTIPEFHLLAQAGSGRQAVDHYVRLRPDIVLMDLAMPLMNGLAAIAAIKEIDAAANIVILTTYQGEEDVHRGLHAGAQGYLLKDCGLEQLILCVRTVAAGRRFVPPELAAKLDGRLQANRLSKRELDILAALAAGQSNKIIARGAGIELGTVKFHVNNILSKLNVSSRTAAATVATRRGLLNPF